MGRPKKQQPTATKIFEGSDGLWHGYVAVGVRPDGRSDRRHRSGKTYEECEAKVRALEAQLAAKTVPKPGRVPTLEQWLTTWLQDVVADLRYATRERSYGWAVRRHLIPGLGGHRLDALEAHHIERFYRKIGKRHPDDKEGLSASSVAAIHRALRAALNEAKRRGIIAKSPMEAVRAPRVEEEEVTPLFVHEVKRIIAVCDRRRNGTRWTVGMPLGLRQGEALGLRWMRPSTSTRDKPHGLDLHSGYLVVRKKAERHKWEHGCADPHACGWIPRRVGGVMRPLHRMEPCPPSWGHGCDDPESCRRRPGKRSANPNLTARSCPQRVQVPCRRHDGDCPPPCPRDCTDHARSCPQREGGIVYEDTKSAAGRRRMALAAPMLARILAHKEAQDVERKEAGSLWLDVGLVWCQPTGRPIDASADWKEWKEVLREAGVRDARLHDGRHTAATMLLLEGVDHRTVMEIMGWSDSRMIKRYQHVIDELRVEAARRVGELLFDDSATDLATRLAERSPRSKKNRPIT